MSDQGSSAVGDEAVEVETTDAAEHTEATEKKSARKAKKPKAPRRPGGRRWVPPTFIAVALLGVAWLITYYLTTATGMTVPLMTELGPWNVAIGLGLMASSFGIATLWK